MHCTTRIKTKTAACVSLPSQYKIVNEPKQKASLDKIKANALKTLIFLPPTRSAQAPRPGGVERVIGATAGGVNEDDIKTS
ncbi:hypothetical protein A3843_05700 [Pseudovibrio exalbescens]|uniref:Uncharacterized protein n=1 Tax=Pseudovibrio exalbescens TaxID=197461 RepID=A0A1U7JJA3_9HYPH|nr:hypothetical protein A3843_05700 [Pseudovibrio exalbescens]